MNRERLIQLLQWADATKWPKWEQVMYHNNVTVAESVNLCYVLASFDDPSTLWHVQRGTKAFAPAALTDAELRVDDRFVEAVEDRVSMGNSAWDMVAPKLILRAALEVAEGIGNSEVKP